MGFPLYLTGGIAASKSENVLKVTLLSVFLFWPSEEKNKPVNSDRIIKILIQRYFISNIQLTTQTRLISGGQAIYFEIKNPVCQAGFGLFQLHIRYPEERKQLI
jgi:hypothetical protein